MKRFAFVTALAAVSALALAQDPHPRGKAETTVNGKKVVIEYGRPDLAGRSLDDLMKNLPEDRVWRAGENQVTTLETGTDLMIGGKKVPAGKYSLYVHAPTQGDWSLLVNEHLGMALGEMWAQAPPELAKEPWPMLAGYDKNIKDQEVARVPLKGMSGSNLDVFTIALEGDQLKLSWGDQAWGTTVEPAT